MAGVRQFDEEQALEKALEYFWQKGFAAASMPELAAATGVQRGSLYNAYQGKENLFLKVFEMYSNRFLQQVEQTLTAPDLRQALEAFFEFVIGSMTMGVPTRGCLSTKTAFTGDQLEEPVAEVLRGMLDRLERILASSLRSKESQSALTCSPESAARLLVTFTRGLVVIERVYQDTDRLKATALSLLDILIASRND
ncbi:TetR family transcriptional regulator [Silvimonas amylolytica]|uniref:TetR family transcriptional regulator n=1 Tax=Silvimonas amylolytica TaxID=449663 RepID=A0ABQ2PQ97_9NEIS|nr:TetR family transcriptional regulator [Silvimonas amylolytica]